MRQIRHRSEKEEDDGGGVGGRNTHHSPFSSFPFPIQHLQNLDAVKETRKE
jgi:hypothetical protein